MTYGCVVRLKGGDSFIFGRGSEEIEYAESFGIPTFVVPGISSAIAVPAYQGISLTKRGTIDTIQGVAAENQLSSPAIIVIGEVVKESNKLKGFYEEFVGAKTRI